MILQIIEVHLSRIKTKYSIHKRKPIQNNIQRSYPGPTIKTIPQSPNYTRNHNQTTQENPKKQHNSN